MNPRGALQYARALIAAALKARLLLSIAASAAAGEAFAQDFRVEEATIPETHAAFLSGEITCVELTREYLGRIRAYDQRGPRLNAIAALNPAVLAEAALLDSVRAREGISGPLHCIPVLLKDQVETREMPTTFGSALFEGFTSSRDATIVRRMKDAGALILAKTNMGEFASRYVGSGFGFIRNPYDPSRNPSGSSGGTGAGVAANFGMVGIGEDTGGSIRGPAAVHSLVGLRPTLELVSRNGMMPANPSTDTMGPMARTVLDAAILLDVIAGYDPLDPITAESFGETPASYSEGLSPDGLAGARIGIIRDPMDQALDTMSEGFREARALMDAAAMQLEALGAEVVDAVAIPSIQRVNAVFAMNTHETEGATDAYLAELEDSPYSTLRSILLSGRVTPWRARGLAASLGKTTSDPGYLEYLLARDEIRREVYRAMADHELDALAYATFDHPPSLIAPDVETNPRPNDDYGMGDNRLLSPLLSFPALTVPAGFTQEGLPIGIEFLGRPFTEAMLLGFGYAFEHATGHRRPPPSAPPLR